MQQRKTARIQNARFGLFYLSLTVPGFASGFFSFIVPIAFENGVSLNAYGTLIGVEACYHN
jgi:hypothetical protein